MPIELAVAVALEGQVLAWEQNGNGYLAVTKRSLVSITGDEVMVTPWTDSLQAKWDPPQLNVIFQSQDAVKPEVKSWTLEETSQLPRAVRDRVTSAVVVDRVFELPTAGKVRFVARKDEYRAYWSAIADNPEMSQTDSGKQEIASALAELRSTFGI